MSKEKEPKEIVFSEQVDSCIDGLTLGFAFIAIGIFLLLIPDYFGIKIVGQIVRWIFIIIGALGLFVELGKLKPISTIKGFDDLWMGIILLAVWSAVFLLTKKWIWRALGFVLLILGTYGSCRGVLKIIYSVVRNRRSGSEKKGIIVSDIVVFLTKVISLAIIIIQLIKVVQ